MSDVQEHRIDGRTREGRAIRAEANQGQRRRRRTGTLNRMAQFTLDRIEAEDLDLENYVYRWVNDERGRIRAATQDDDYDFVTTDELGHNFDAEDTSGESTERVRMLVGTHKGGGPLYSYLCKKPRAFWEEDNEAVVRAREDMMAGRVYRGEEEDDDAKGDASNRYVPGGVTMGSASGRRRGPVPRNFK